MAGDWSEEPDCAQRGSDWTDFGGLSQAQPVRRVRRRRRRQREPETGGGKAGARPRRRTRRSRQRDSQQCD
ncbi:MAG: hypothetical protein BEU05_02540 [Marine Group III euryarchaeote CG-Bathy2]|uniref:Uncharacterized protein n=1 Tax=Marine Group III euryarchaeote CG-Bathy2 TaxID=1889002 RepID=A0A1J5T046_9ARCH|nr:MAG: hypothetical protein BEU05_02540 [Marine Group III euryarchaeote CG-Bathy2]